MDEKLYTFKTDKITVTWSKTRCTHVAACVRGLPQVFDPGRRPWIEPGLASSDDVAETVRRCPTGALHYERHDGGTAETPLPVNTVAVEPFGALQMRGDIHVVNPDGTLVLRDTRVALCRCGATKDPPICDGSHWEAGFDDRGQLGTSPAKPAEGEPGTPLRVTVKPGGSLWLSGPFVLTSVGAGGEAPRKLGEAWLCRCGASKNKPFCDGSHKDCGFTG